MIRALSEMLAGHVLLEAEPATDGRLLTLLLVGGKGKGATLGHDETAQIVYGQPLESSEAALENLRELARRVPVRTLAREAGLATETIQRVRSGEVGPRPRTVALIGTALQRLSSRTPASC